MLSLGCLLCSLCVVSPLLLFAVGEYCFHDLRHEDRRAFEVRGFEKLPLWGNENGKEPRLTAPCVDHSRGFADVRLHVWSYWISNPDYCTTLCIGIAFITLCILTVFKCLTKNRATVSDTARRYGAQATLFSGVAGSMLFALFAIAVDARVHNGYGTEEEYYVLSQAGIGTHWYEIGDRVLKGMDLDQHGRCDVLSVARHMVLYFHDRFATWMATVCLIGALSLLLRWSVLVAYGVKRGRIPTRALNENGTDGAARPRASR